MQSLPDIHDITRGKWAGLLPLFGVPETILNGKHHPCPMCGGTDRWRWDEGFYKQRGGYICNQCGTGTGVDLVMKLTGQSFPEVCKEIKEKAGTIKPAWKRAAAKPKFDASDWIERMWKEARPIGADDPAALHLRRRGLALDKPPSQLRFAPRVKYNHGDGITATYHPAMIAQFVGPSINERSIHFTYLDAEGRKARLDPVRKFAPGSPPKGGAVRLMPSAETMGIAEGVETALAASMLHGVPVWAALNKTLLMQWQPPETVKSVIVFGDNDTNCSGQAAAFHLANRLICGTRKLHVEVRVPDLADTDWNDVLTTQER